MPHRRTTPLAGQTGVTLRANVSAAFSELMKVSSSRNATASRSTTFTLARKNANETITKVAAKVRYDVAAEKVVLKPDVALSPICVGRAVKQLLEVKETLSMVGFP